MSIVELKMKLTQLPLRPHTLSVFQRHGFDTVADVFGAKRAGCSAVAAELHCEIAQAVMYCREVESAYHSVTNFNGNLRSSLESSLESKLESNLESNLAINLARGRTAAQVLDEIQQKQTQSGQACARYIVTFCRTIDQLLGGGIALGEVTEVAGPPGIGKTQLSLQLAVNVSLPQVLGGVKGECIYIDTEGSFAPERCEQIAEALVNHVGNCNRNSSCEDLNYFTVEYILRGIHIFRVFDEVSQTATIHTLSTFIEERKRCGLSIKLIIVDSIAFHIRVSEIRLLLEPFD